MRIPTIRIETTMGLRSSLDQEPHSYYFYMFYPFPNPNGDKYISPTGPRAASVPRWVLQIGTYLQG